MVTDADGNADECKEKKLPLTGGTGLRRGSDVVMVDANGVGHGCKWWWTRMVVDADGGGCGWWWTRMVVDADGGGRG